MTQLMFSSVGIMLLYMLVGVCLCKGKKAVVAHAKSFSGLLIYILGPSMILNSFLNLEYSAESVYRICKYFAISFVVQASAFALLYLLLHKHYNDAKYRILSVGSVLGNVGFIGMPLVASVFPDDPIVLCYSSINVMSMNLIVFTIGTFMITGDKKYISLRNAVLNPTTIAIMISLPLYFFNLHFPSEIEAAIALMAKMVTPVCMLILGMRLSGAKIREIFTRPFVYASCLLKLVVFPLFAYLLVHWLPFADSTLKTCIVVLAMTPSGAIIESLAELYECEQDIAANVVLLTTILSIVTIPVMAFLLI